MQNNILLICFVLSFAVVLSTYAGIVNIIKQVQPTTKVEENPGGFDLIEGDIKRPRNKNGIIDKNGVIDENLLWPKKVQISCKPARISVKLQFLILFNLAYSVSLNIFFFNL